jgi:hypothetical protein
MNKRGAADTAQMFLPEERAPSFSDCRCPSDILNVGPQMSAIRNGKGCRANKGLPEDVCANNRRKKCPMKEIYDWH